MSIRIIMDSTADIPERLKPQVVTVPLTVFFGEQEYKDGINLTRSEFYDKLVASDKLPTTSQATPAVFEEVFRQVTEAGDSAVCLCVSSALSGTYQSACIAAEDFPNIRVIDTLNVAIASGILVVHALDCVAQGMELDELTAHLEKKKMDLRIVALLDTLEYLQKGGRISKTVAWAGNLLNVKPVVTVTDGEVVLMGKARGIKKGNNLLNERIQKDGVDFDLPIMLGYSGNSDATLQTYVRESRALWEGHGLESFDTEQICSVVGVHVGPGAMAVAYFAKEQ